MRKIALTIGVGWLYWIVGGAIAESVDGVLRWISNYARLPETVWLLGAGVVGLTALHRDRRV